MAYTPNDQISTYSGGVDNAVSSLRPNRNAFNQQQQGQETDFLNRYTNAINSQETLPALYTRLSEKFGIPQLTTNAQNLRNTLTNMPSTYSKATTGYDVNQNQLDRIVGNKTAALTPAVTAAEGALTNAQNQVGTQMTLEQNQQAKALKPYESEQSLLSNRLAREATGYSQDSENELNALIEKMRQGVQLSLGEQQRANELAIAEKNYQAKIAEINAQSKYAALPINSAGVYNVQTGKREGWG